MESVVFIESNFTGIDAIKKSAQAGLKCYLVTSNLAQLKSMLPPELFDGLEQCSTIVHVQNSDDSVEVLNAIQALGTSVSAVLTFSQFRLLTASRVAAALGLKGTSTDALSAALDKFRLREVMAQAGAPSIKFLKLQAHTTSNDVLATVGLPCIIKPARGHSSLGVQFVQSGSELEIAVLKFRTAGTGAGEMIVEEYLEGPLFSLESVTEADGVHAFWGYTDRLLTHDFIEIGATFPSSVPSVEDGQRLVAAALSAIGFNFGSCHTEMIFTSRGPRIVEINPRPGGSGVCRLVERATGHDVILDYVLMHLGKNPKSDLSYQKSVTMRSVLPEISGRIAALPTREQILNLPGVKDVWFQRKIGDLTDDSRSNFSWLFTLLTEPSDGKTSVENAENAVQLLSSEVQIQNLAGNEAQCTG